MKSSSVAASNGVSAVSVAPLTNRSVRLDVQVELLFVPSSKIARTAASSGPFEPRNGRSLHCIDTDWNTGGPFSSSAGFAGCTVVALSTRRRSEEHTSELQSLMRISYAVFCLKKKTNNNKLIVTHATP